MIKIKSFQKFKLIYFISIVVVNVIALLLSIFLNNNDISLVIQIVFALLLLFVINSSSNDISKRKDKAETKNDKKELDNSIEIHKALWFGLMMHIFILLVIQILLNTI